MLTTIVDLSVALRSENFRHHEEFKMKNMKYLTQLACLNEFFTTIYRLVKFGLY